MIKALEIKVCKEQLRELGMFIQEKGKRRGEMAAIFKYLKGCYVEDGTRLFSTARGSRKQNKGFKLWKEDFT